MYSTLLHQTSVRKLQSLRDRTRPPPPPLPPALSLLLLPYTLCLVSAALGSSRLMLKKSCRRIYHTETVNRDRCNVKSIRVAWIGMYNEKNWGFEFDRVRVGLPWKTKTRKKITATTAGRALTMWRSRDVSLKSYADTFLRDITYRGRRGGGRRGGKGNIAGNIFTHNTRVTGDFISTVKASSSFPLVDHRWILCFELKTVFHFPPWCFRPFILVISLGSTVFEIFYSLDSVAI